MIMVPPVRSTLPSLPAASSASSVFTRRSRISRRRRRGRALGLLFPPEYLRQQRHQRYDRYRQDLPELDQQRRQQREQSELLRRDPAHQGGQAELGDVVGGRVEVPVALAVVVLERGEQLVRDRLFLLDRVRPGDQVQADVALTPKGIGVVVDAALGASGLVLLLRRQRPYEAMRLRVVILLLDPAYAF